MERYKVYDRLGQTSQYKNTKVFYYEVLDLKGQSFKCSIKRFQIFWRVKLDSWEYKVYNMLVENCLIWDPKSKVIEFSVNFLF